ncbi:TonB family protein [Persicitalea sp.]|uniref:TonB family protein n=1 Tax=Persicitalea sp. TaxID=3100273 RepID=UPI00359404E6
MKAPAHLLCSAVYLLDCALGDPLDSLTNNFLSCSTLKNRIAMLYKDRNSKWALGKYAAVVAFVGSVALLMAFKPALSPEVPALVTQKVTIKGSVVNTDNQSLADVFVITADLRNHFVTDDLGQYELSIPAGSELVFNKKDYKPVKVTVKDNQVIDAVLAASKSADSSVVSVYPFVITERMNPGQSGYGGMFIPKFLPDIKLKSDSVQTFKYHFLSDNSLPPAFPGGSDALRAFIARNATYPKGAVRANVQGKVLVNFMVSASGAIRQVNILKSPRFGLEQETARLMAAMPAWLPGQQDGKKVETPYQLTLDYRLATDSLKTGTLEAQAGLDGKGASYAIVRFYQPISRRTHTMVAYFNGFDDQYGLENALYVLDGKPVGDRETMGKIPADQIVSVNIVRGAAAKKLYGEKGANGVVAIATRKAVKKM